MTSPITTHVLDLKLGLPAAGLRVRLQCMDGREFIDVAEGLTNADGRITDLLPPDELLSGVYRLLFETGSYFASVGQAEHFYPTVVIDFLVTEVRTHYHVPLLLSPFGYSRILAGHLFSDHYLLFH